MATRKRSTTSSGFLADTAPVEEETVVEITEPSTPEELAEEVKAIEEFIEEATFEQLANVEKEEAKEEPPAPAPVMKNPDPVKQVGLTRHRRNIPRFARR